MIPKSNSMQHENVITKRTVTSIEVQILCIEYICYLVLVQCIPYRCSVKSTRHVFQNKTRKINFVYLYNQHTAHCTAASAKYRKRTHFLCSFHLFHSLQYTQLPCDHKQERTTERHLVVKYVIIYNTHSINLLMSTHLTSIPCSIHTM